MTILDQRHLFIPLAIIVLAGCVPVALTVTPRPDAPGGKGAPGMGDPYFPTLGNGGYDVQTYTITLEVDPLANTVEGSTFITATATKSLSSFNLDFHDLNLDSVTVNDLQADYSHTGSELTILPAATLQAGQSFTTAIRYYGSPGMITSQAGLSSLGWSHAGNGVINVWGEPDAASSWFPNNNHPRDKAMFRFEITVPDPWVVAATGTLQERLESDGKSTYIWEMDQPMATYLASINIDHYELVTQAGPNEIQIRNYFPADFPASSRLSFETLPAMIDFFDDFFGPYPFAEYGVVIAGKDGLCAQTQIAMETQTLSLHCPSGIMTSEQVNAHELAHMWFGDSVSLENWKDIWLKEGFATYADWLWRSKNDPTALSAIAQNARNDYFDTAASIAEPEPNHIYSSESYIGGALVLYALKVEVGEEAFYRVLQTYTDRYKFGNADTDEFMAVAEEVSGRDLSAFFEAWLFSPQLPELSAQLNSA